MIKQQIINLFFFFPTFQLKKKKNAILAIHRLRSGNSNLRWLNLDGNIGLAGSDILGIGLSLDDLLPSQEVSSAQLSQPLSVFARRPILGGIRVVLNK